MINNANALSAPGTFDGTELQKVSRGAQEYATRLTAYSVFLIESIAIDTTPDVNQQGKLFLATAALNINLSASRPVGFNFSVVQTTAGQVTAVPGASATLVGTGTKTSAQWSVITLTVITSGVWLITGSAA